MKGLNEVNILGHLGANPELRTTRSGKSVCEISVATNRRVQTDDGHRDIPTWHRVTLWENDAEMACRALTKGSPVFIKGSIRTDSWEDKNTGQRRYKTYIVCQSLHLLPPTRLDAMPREAAARQVNTQAVPHAQLNEEAIPF